MLLAKGGEKKGTKAKGMNEAKGDTDSASVPENCGLPFGRKSV